MKSSHSIAPQLFDDRRVFESVVVELARRHPQNPAIRQCVLEYAENLTTDILLMIDFINKVDGKEPIPDWIKERLKTHYRFFLTAGNKVPFLRPQSIDVLNIMASFEPDSASGRQIAGIVESWEKGLPSFTLGLSNLVVRSVEPGYTRARIRKPGGRGH